MLTSWVQARLVRLGSWMPFAHAARALGALRRVSGGALVALIGRPWVAGKPLALGTSDRAARGEVRAHDLSSCSRRTDHATFRRLALVETHRRGGGTAGTVVAVPDGAAWLRGFVAVPRRDAVRVLDFPHAGEHRAAALAYRAPRLPQLQSPTFRAAGYPIGRGRVAGANQVVVQDRLKGSGRHGAPACVDPMLALRTVVCADRGEEAWPRISARLRAAARSRRQRRHRRAGECRVARRADQAASQAPAAPAPTSPVTPTRPAGPR